MTLIPAIYNTVIDLNATEIVVNLSNELNRMSPLIITQNMFHLFHNFYI